MTVARMRLPGLLIALVVGVFALAACNPIYEADALSRLNQLRTAHGLTALVRDPVLDRKANAQAVRMARQEQISHSPDLKVAVPDGWKALGENVGVGPSIAVIHDALVNSPGHLANMLDARFGKVGLGSVQRNGRIYLVQFFEG